MRKLFQFSGLVFIATILTAYYLIGAENFPDYANYLGIAENGGWLYSEDEYIFEWISRALLTIGPSLAISPGAAVDLLAVVNQVICCAFFVYLLQAKESRYNYGATLLLAWVGFLLFTTTLRATPAYLILSVFILRGGKVDLAGLAMLIFGLGWHDSFALPAGIAITASVSTAIPWLQRYAERISLNRLMVYGAMLLLLVSDQLRDFALSLLDVSIGLKDAYLGGESAHSLVKLVYCGVAVLMSWQISGQDSGLAPRVQRFAALMAVVIAASYVINGVAAVRIAMFSYCAFIPLRGFFVLSQEQHPLVRVIQLAATPALLALSMYDTLQRTV